LNLKSSNSTFHQNEARKHVLPKKFGKMCFLFLRFRGVFDEENEDMLPKRKRADFSALIIWNILHDVSNLTGQDSAKHFNGMGADAFIPF